MHAVRVAFACVDALTFPSGLRSLQPPAPLLLPLPCPRLPVRAGKRARILREGQLTMITYGANEALTWARRVGAFQHTMRCVEPAMWLVVGACLCCCVSAWLCSSVTARVRACVQAAGTLSTTTTHLNPMLWLCACMRCAAPGLPCLAFCCCSGVLGDRRLTFNWGGSVLDSVVGVFLTQVGVGVWQEGNGWSRCAVGGACCKQQRRLMSATSMVLRRPVPFLHPRAPVSTSAKPGLPSSTSHCVCTPNPRAECG